MRAGSLSSKDVIRRLKSDFTCVWTNTEGERNAGGSYAHPPSDPAPSCLRGNGEHNVQMLFLTPDHKVLHAVAGYISAPELLTEMKFVDTLWSMVQRAQTPTAKSYLVQGVHRRARENLRRRVDLPGKADPRRQTDIPRLADLRGPDGTDLFARMRGRRLANDLRFVERHPLMPASSYRSDDHVGTATSWFGSSRGGTPTDSIGTPFERPLSGR